MAASEIAQPSVARLPTLSSANTNSHHVACLLGRARTRTSQ
jgi:hypothetical protein